MKAGNLRNRVTIQDKVVSRDTFGEEVITWTDLATVWAAVEPLRGREYLEGRQLEAELTTRIRIRRRSGLVPTMRVVWGSHVYDVVSVQEIESRRREIHLLCQEIITE